MAENGQWTETSPINHQCPPSELQCGSPAVCAVLVCLCCNVIAKVPALSCNAVVFTCVLQNALQFIKQYWKMSGRPLFLVLIREDNIK